MTTTSNPKITQPGGYSAKNTRRVGAPNNHQGSGENPMVGNNPQDNLWATIVERLFGPGQDPRAGRATLWELLKAQTRVVMRLRQENVDLCDAVMALSAQNRVLLRQVSQMRAGHTAVQAEHSQMWSERDVAVRESELREQEVIALTVERDKALDRVTELESALRRAGYGAGEQR